MKKKFWIATIGLIGLILFSCCVGRYDLSLIEIFRILSGQAKEEMDKTLFYKIRLSRTFFVVLAGGGLSLAGWVYQSIFKNPLVSPDVLGVSSGCSIGAIIAILSSGQNAWLSQGLSCLFGILTVGITMVLARCLKGERRYILIISGILVGAFANSIIMTLKYTADPNRELPAIEYWLMGTFQHATWGTFLQVLPVIMVTTIVLYLIRWKIKILALGEEEAQSLGIHVSFIRAVALLCATILVAVIVSVTGIIAWLGLIAPHVVRMIFGADFSKNFMPAILIGSILLLISDICARTLFTAEIPISILTSFLGAILLGIFLVVQKRV